MSKAYGRRTGWKVVFAALAVVVVVASNATAAFQAAESCGRKTDPDRVLGTHATRGVVRSIDANTMVIERSGRSGDMRFNLTCATYRDGLIDVGSVVSVRYLENGKNHVATAIALQRPRSEG